MNSEILLQVSNMVKEVPITKLSDDDFSESPAEQSRLLNEVPEVIAETIDEETEPAYKDSTRKEGQECKDGSSDSAPSRTSKTSSGDSGQQEMIMAVAAVITGKSVQVEEPVLTSEMNNVDHLSCMNCYEATMSPLYHDASQEPTTPSSPQAQAHTPPPDPPQSFPLATASESTSPNLVNSMPWKIRRLWSLEPQPSNVHPLLLLPM
ncbi:hypothetical protein LWI28_008884 [Acer negundo]|uniref:Uncharacterized protein n=1 Tax=Acer negundo TaxID=4023 RepID=A0AAD5NQ52_ACENE|nr:hypothetical protein LWI28_008884 [Acer negundo]